MTLRKKIIGVLDHWGKKRLFWGGLAVVYLAVAVLVVIPRGKKTLDDHKQVQQLTKELADLDAWTVAGKWLAPEVARREPVVNAAWGKAFPSHRQREELFLDIAKVADASGLVDFRLREIEQVAEMSRPRLQDTLDARMQSGGAVYGVPVEVPHIGLSTYRVKASFHADYQAVTHFLWGLQHIDRALSVHDLVLRNDKKQVKVDLEMEIYVSQIS